MKLVITIDVPDADIPGNTDLEKKDILLEETVRLIKEHWMDILFESSGMSQAYRDKMDKYAKSLKRLFWDDDKSVTYEFVTSIDISKNTESVITVAEGMRNYDNAFPDVGMPWYDDHYIEQAVKYLKLTPSDYDYLEVASKLKSRR